MTDANEASPKAPPPLVLNSTGLGLSLTEDRKLCVLTLQNVIGAAQQPMDSLTVDGLIEALQNIRRDMVNVGGLVLPPEGFKLP